MAWAVCLALASTRCSSAGPSPSTEAPGSSHAGTDPLAIMYEPESFVGQEKLLGQIRSSAFAYFRFIGEPFARLVCERYRDRIAGRPTVSLHGDAHLEQYAVADDGFGMVDFDDATLGPPVLDWLRFATSVWLATPDEEAAHAAIERLVDGYRRGLRDPEAVIHAEEPGVARRIREGFNTTPEEWLDQITALIQPVDQTDGARLQRARAGYLSEVEPKNPQLPARFFDLKTSGGLRVGIGSARQSKYLLRVEGPSRDAADDLILEEKQMKHASVIPCARGDASDPARVIAADAKFSRSPRRLLGHARVDGELFYVHVWRVHYTEIRHEDLRDDGELEELAYDFGLQLGRGHPLQPFGSVQGRAERRALDKLVDEIEDELRVDSRELAARVRRSFEDFRTASAPRTN